MKVFADARKQLGSIYLRCDLTVWWESQIPFGIFAKAKMHIIKRGIRIRDHERFSSPQDEHFWNKLRPAHSKLGLRAFGWLRARPDTRHYMHDSAGQGVAILRRRYFPRYFRRPRHERE